MLTPIQQHFRNSMAKLAAGVNIITTNGIAGKCGITATAVCSVTDTPPTIMVCINKNSEMNPVFQTNKRLCVNVLSAEQLELAQHFAGFMGSCMDERFEWAVWHEKQDPVAPPSLKNALANLTGTIVDIRDIGTHSMFLVELEEIQVNEEQEHTLVYFSRQFHTVGTSE
ncbi:TPA: 4-hydroxyphenylacetate 3-monooxygenase, reductase component [Pasteurella multocida]|nr:4-hydroxyphenylacetate 3-monooxygenase, reductase component [Pasteurella multocida]HDR1505814.1 4-hydroxyphenylacetate 3-monooxygenase, reductase component [Pasteurella multocida]HDR1585686.1 4-hydroxyphenylacetate 3-monooxygenase, reductase component [Pasteurella multocida]HDR1912835.1 4-hydroxyphenylacetate 3-monooxygenase, reductase component [Pasteurella multocida]